MAINDVAGGRVYRVWDILWEFLGHNFVSGLRKLNLQTKNPKETLKPKNLKTFT